VAPPILNLQKVETAHFQPEKQVALEELHDSLLVKETDEDVYRQTFGCDTQGDRPSFVTETPNYQEMFSSTSMPNHNINLTPNSANLQNMHENQQRF